MRKFYTIGKTLHTSRPALIEMVKVLTGNRKSVDQKKTLTEKKNLRGQEPKKKIAPMERQPENFSLPATFFNTLEVNPLNSQTSRHDAIVAD